MRERDEKGERDKIGGEGKNMRARERWQRGERERGEECILPGFVHTSGVITRQ